MPEEFEMQGNNTRPEIEMYLEIRAETSKAVCVRNLKDVDVWLPKSQIEEANNDPGTFLIPEWLATEKDLI